MTIDMTMTYPPRSGSRGPASSPANGLAKLKQACMVRIEISPTAPFDNGGATIT